MRFILYCVQVYNHNIFIWRFMFFLCSEKVTHIVWLLNFIFLLLFLKTKQKFSFFFVHFSRVHSLMVMEASYFRLQSQPQQHEFFFSVSSLFRMFINTLTVHSVSFFWFLRCLACWFDFFVVVFHFISRKKKRKKIVCIFSLRLRLKLYLFVERWLSSLVATEIRL